MDFGQLEIFVRVAGMKSFTKAAKSLFLSQPTISARIKSLEDEIGVILLDRSRPRELFLTEDGKVFWNYAQNFLNKQKEMLNEFKAITKQQDSFISVGCSSVPGIYIMPEVLACFNGSSNNIKINIAISDTEGIISDIIDYGYDFGLVGYMDKNKKLDYIPFSEDEMLLVTAAGKLKPLGFISGDDVPLEIIKNMKLILRRPGSATRRVFEQNLLKHGHATDTFDAGIVLDSLEGIKQAVRYDLGVSIMSKCSVKDYISTGLLDGYRFINVKLKRNFYIVCHKSRVMSGATLSLINYIQNYSHLPLP